MSKTALAIVLCATLIGCAPTLSLRSINEQAKLAPGNCRDHVQEVGRLLDGKYRVRAIYTSNRWMRDGHVSALVETERGLFVLDNGALQFESDVIPLDEYVAYSRKFLVREFPVLQRLDLKPE